jgi:hypothetical protein
MPTDKEIAQTAEVWAFQAYTLGVRKPPAHAGHALAAAKH